MFSGAITGALRGGWRGTSPIKPEHGQPLLEFFFSECARIINSRVQSFQQDGVPQRVCGLVKCGSMIMNYRINLAARTGARTSSKLKPVSLKEKPQTSMF
jgi:hypothetical protein